MRGLACRVLERMQSQKLAEFELQRLKESHGLQRWCQKVYCGTSGHWCFVKHHWQGCWCQRPVCLQAGWLWQKKSHHSSECQRCALQCRIRKGILQNLQWWDPCRAAEAMHLTACPVSQHQRMERWSLGRKDCKSAGVPSQPCEKVEKGSCQKEAVHAGSHRGAKASHPGVCGFACCLQESNSSSARLSCLWWWPGLQEGQKSQEIQLCFFFLLRPRPARRPRVPVLLLCLLLKEPRPARRPGFWRQKFLRCLWIHKGFQPCWHLQRRWKRRRLQRVIQNQFPFWKNKGPATEISWNRLQKLLPRTS